MYLLPEYADKQNRINELRQAIENYDAFKTKTPYTKEEFEKKLAELEA